MAEVALFDIKVVSTLLMLLLTIIFCVLPWMVKRRWRKSNWLISLLNCLAGGVVLGALLLHMIPEMVVAHDGASCKGGFSSYPWGSFAAGASFLLLFSVDRLILSHAHCENVEEDEDGLKRDVRDYEHGHSHSHGHGHSHGHAHECNDPHAYPHDHHHGHHHPSGPLTLELKSKESFESDSTHEDCHEADIMGGCHMEGISTSKNQLQTYVFVFCLSLHSLLEGLGMSGKTNVNELWSFLIGLFAHKWIEAFALGITVMKARFSAARAFSLLGFYAILTPLGIVLGMLADYLSIPSVDDGKSLTTLVLNGAAAGSFMFVACIEMIPPEFHTRNQSTIPKFMALCIGFLLMASVATFHSH